MLTTQVDLILTVYLAAHRADPEAPEAVPPNGKGEWYNFAGRLGVLGEPSAAWLVAARALTCGLGAEDGTRNQGFCTADPGFNRDGSTEAISGTGTALHTSVLVKNPRLSVLDHEDAVRANVEAHPTPVALLYVHSQRRHARKVAESNHDLVLLSQNSVTRNEPHPKAEVRWPHRRFAAVEPFSLHDAHRKATCRESLQ